MRIYQRLVLHTANMAFVAVIITSGILGGLAYWLAKSALEKEIIDDLVSIRELRKEQIEQYFDIARKQVIEFSNIPYVTDAMTGLNTAFHNYYQELSQEDKNKFKPESIHRYLNDFSDKYHSFNEGLNLPKLNEKKLLNLFNKSSFSLQYYYVLDSPYSLDKKRNLTSIEDGTNYSKLHKKHHPYFLNYLERFQYYDLLLVDIDTGDIIYSVDKELDFTTSLIDGPYANTVLGKVFQKAKNLKKNATVLSDFESYVPSYNKKSSFIATPIFQGEKKIGVLIIQLSSDVINHIMSSNGQWQKIGLGETGETYLVGPDFHLRSVSRFHNPLQEDQTIVTTSIIQALRGETNAQIIRNKDGNLVVSAYTPLNIPGLEWIITSEISVQEAFAIIDILRNQMVAYAGIAMLIILMFSLLVAFRLSRKISYPIEKLSSIIYTFAHEKDLTKRIFFNSQDELEEMASALNYLLDSFQNICQEALYSTDQVRSNMVQLSHVAEHLGSASFQTENLTNEIDVKVLSEVQQNLTSMSDKLQIIAGQFKTIEEEQEKLEDW